MVGAAPGDLEPAAWKAVHHGESSLAVVGPDGILRGLVPPARLLSLLLETHDQDFARLRDYLESTREARRAAEEPVSRRFRHRFWWLVLGLTGAALSAWIVGRFEGRIATDIRLAFFIPGVVYLADAVGTQTEAVMVRGLSVGAPARAALRLESLTGPTMGLVLAALELLRRSGWRCGTRRSPQPSPSRCSPRAAWRPWWRRPSPSPWRAPAATLRSPAGRWPPSSRTS